MRADGDGRERCIAAKSVAVIASVAGFITPSCLPSFNAAAVEPSWLISGGLPCDALRVCRVS